jgi:hypothetical protein
MNDSDRIVEAINARIIHYEASQKQGVVALTTYVDGMIAGLKEAMKVASTIRDEFD